MNNNIQQICEPVEITDKKGVHKFLYLCKQPFVNRLAAYKHNRIHLWTDIALVATVVILIATLASLLVFTFFKQKNQIRITLAPKHVVLGEVATFDVTYENTSKKKPTHETNITLRAPQTFKNATLVSPLLEEVSLTLPLGTLDPQESGGLEVQGELFANINSDITLLFVTDYVNDLGEPQQESTLTNFTINKSTINITANPTTRSIVGSDFSFDISFDSVPLDISAYTLTITHPQGFTLDASSETLTQLTQDKKTLHIVGVVGGTPSTSPLVISLNKKVDQTNIIYSQITSPLTTNYSRIKIDGISLSPNITPGDSVTIQTIITNNESNILENARLVISTKGEFVDITHLESTYGAQRNKFEVPLGNIAVGGVVVHDINIKALSRFIPKDDNLKNTLGPQNIEIYYKVVGTLNGNEISISGPTQLSIPVNSAPQLIAQALFFTNTGDQIGVGSVPPRVDEYSSYWGIVRISNGVNPLSNATVRATIPAYIDYSDVYNITDGSPVRFIESSRQIEWYIGDVASYAGVITQAPEMRVELGITPMKDQIGQVPTLLTNITLSGIDTRTGQNVTATASNISTGIFKDQGMNRVK